ncbi:MAG: isoprenylcysteine carboxylmethyltransferase family protein [Candidatus Dormibacteraeota bacterium]|nr:isoprenylcysteine carboxylmethyltransferase family protein [Candidatus Dormibacteraeota bacterium]
MEPLVYREPLAIAAFAATLVTWWLSEMRIMVRNRGGGGENLDRGSRVWVVLLIAAGTAAAFGLAWLDVGRIAGWAVVAGGVVLALAGIVLRQWSVATLGAFFTTAVEVQAGHRIIDRGPYSRLRHPSYTGALLTVVGVALALDSWIGCIAAAAFSLAGLVQRILVEERALASRLGPAWTAYAQGRKRLIPLVW